MSATESPTTTSSTRFARRILAADRATWLIALAYWVSFFVLPLLAGAVLKAILDRVSGTSANDVWWLVAALAGLEVGRWAILLPAIVQWHGGWVFWHTVPRVNALRSLVADPGPVTGRLPGSPGEAVSRFRDDARDTAQVLDVWLDVAAALIAGVIGFTVLFTLAPLAGLGVLLPVGLVIWIAHRLGDRLRRWRLAERTATASVAGFVGDAFGAIGAIKVGAAEDAALARFDQLGAQRAIAARRDQVATQLSQALGGITANAGIGLALLLAAPAMRRGDLDVGDVALFMTYANVLASLPRVATRWFTWQRQAEVSAARLGRLMADGEPDGASAPVTTHLRYGPPPFTPIVLSNPADRQAPDRLERLTVRGLDVRFADGHPLQGVDLDVERGELVVITGPVGAGKSVLLRALLGLVPADGTIRWNGEPVDEPSHWFVPPRAAFVPQVPRLFSEPLRDTVLLGLDDSGFERALELACLDEDLATMTDGVQTRVGPKGVRLSGGQVQRTAAARALIRRPELLLIDDLSSALDVQTEARIWDGVIGATHGNLTVIAVSHRPRVLERADQIIRLDAGST